MRTPFVLASVLWAASALIALHAAAQPPQSDDAALRALVRDTLARHPQVLAAETALDSDRSNQAAAERPLFNPELELGFEDSDTNDAELRVSQTLDRANQRGARSRVAARRVDVGREELALARRDLVLELLVALADYWGAYERSSIAAGRVELLQRLADVVAARGRVGDATQADENLARLASAQAHIDRARAEAERAAAEQRLRALAAAGPPASWPGLPTELPAIDRSDERSAGFIAALPEVTVRRRELEVAGAEIDLRERQRRANPTLSLAGGEDEDEPMIGLSFSMPLNVRNRYRHEVEAARAEQRRAELELEAAVLHGRGALEAAAARYELVRGAWTDWRATGAPSLQQQTDLLEQLWRTGELSVTDYLVQLNQTLDTQVSAVELERSLWLAWFDWLGASGQLGDWLGLAIEDGR